MSYLPCNEDAGKEDQVVEHKKGNAQKCLSFQNLPRKFCFHRYMYLQITVCYLIFFFKAFLHDTSNIIFIYLFIYLFMAVLGLHFCARAFSSCGKWGPLFIAVRGLLTIAASCCGAQAPDAQAQ